VDGGLIRLRQQTRFLPSLAAERRTSADRANTKAANSPYSAQGFDLVAGESVVSSLIRRGFHPRLGARPFRGTVEMYLRGAVAGALLAKVRSGLAEFVVCGDELLLRSIEAQTRCNVMAG
jgi:ATP-dependent Clp protease ATP-binding subunit ClpA